MGMETKDLAATVVNSIFDVILILDDKFQVTDANNAVGDLGYTLEDVVGKPIYDLAADRDQMAKAMNDLILASAQGKRDPVRLQVKRKDGSLFFADIFAREIETTVELDYLAIIHDVDDRAKARAALEEQKKIVEHALAQADELRRQAEQSKADLQIANDLLAKRQAATEAQLAKEQEFRLQQGKTDIQRRLVILLVVLVGAGMIIPYISRFFYTADQTMTNSTGQVLLLLVNGLMITITSMFRGKGQEEAPGAGQ